MPATYIAEVAVIVQRPTAPHEITPVIHHRLKQREEVLADTPRVSLCLHASVRHDLLHLVNIRLAPHQFERDGFSQFPTILSHRLFLF
jgi:hypothetical protein